MEASQSCDPLALGEICEGEFIQKALAESGRRCSCPQDCRGGAAQLALISVADDGDGGAAREGTAHVAANCDGGSAKVAPANVAANEEEGLHARVFSEALRAVDPGKGGHRAIILLDLAVVIAADDALGYGAPPLSPRLSPFQRGNELHRPPFLS